MAMHERATVLHSWSVQADWDAPTVVGGQGARLQLADGRTILDMSSLAECSNLGHQHPRLVAAIRAQAERLCFVSKRWGARTARAAGRRLLERRASRAAACSSPSAAPTPTRTR
jgi:taurine--2-oxoglutarate transaminase